MSISMEQDFKIVGKKAVTAKSWNVNSFFSIGWPDPFPDEHSAVDGDFLRNRDDLVYHVERYSFDYSPMMIYIPTKLVLTKIMRACIAVEHKEELWIYGNCF